MNIKTCKDCEAFFIDKEKYKYCPYCGSSLTTHIRIKEQSKSI